MRPHHLRRATLFATSVLLGAACMPGSALLAKQRASDATVCSTPQPFPAGFDYPQPATTVQQWVADADVARARRHGWYLWAGLNHDSGAGPVWRSWCTSTQAFAATPTPEAPTPAATTTTHVSLNALRHSHGLRTGSEDPIDLPGAPGYPIPDAVAAAYPQCVKPGKPRTLAALVDGPTYQNNGDIMIAGVIYDPAAYQAIRTRQLYLPTSFDPKVPPAGETAQLEPLPVGAMVLKPMLWPVRGDGLTALPLWSGPPASDDGAYAGFEIQAKWPDAVAVSTAAVEPGARADVEYLHGVYSSGKLGRRLLPTIRYADVPVVTVDAFYRFEPALDTLDACDRAILDASAWWAYGRGFAAGDQLVLIAMHIMTREQPTWTFQSVWWDNRANSGSDAADRPAIDPAQAPGPWRNYLLASTYGIPDPADPTRWPVAYNPYIELAADHPVRTNCMNCHHRAAWPAARASYEAPDGPDALQIFTLDNPVFDQLLTVDAMWAIPDRVVPAAVVPAKTGGAP